MKVFAFATAVSANCLIKGIVLPTLFQSTPERPVIVVDNRGARVVTNPDNRPRGFEEAHPELPSDFNQLPIHTTVNVEGEHIAIFAQSQDHVNKVVPKLKSHLCEQSEYAPMFPILCHLKHDGTDNSSAQPVTTSFSPITTSARPGRHGSTSGNDHAPLTTPHHPGSATSGQPPISTRFSFNAYTRSRGSGRPTTRRTTKNTNSQGISGSSTAGSLSNGKSVSRSINLSDGSTRSKDSNHPTTSPQTAKVDDERNDRSTSATVISNSSSPSMTTDRSTTLMDNVNSENTSSHTSIRQSLANSSQVLTVTTPPSSWLSISSDTANHSRTTVVTASTALETALSTGQKQNTAGAISSTVSRDISTRNSQAKTSQNIVSTSTSIPVGELSTTESSIKSQATSETTPRSDSHSRSTTTTAATITQTGRTTVTELTQTLLPPTTRTSRPRHTPSAPAIVTEATTNTKHSAMYPDPSSSHTTQQTMSSNPNDNTGYEKSSGSVSSFTTPEWPKELTGPITVWPYTTGISYGRRFWTSPGGAVSLHNTIHNVQDEGSSKGRRPLEEGRSAYSTEDYPPTDEFLSVPESQSLHTFNSSETADESTMSNKQSYAGGNDSSNATQQECGMFSSWGAATYCRLKEEVKNIVKTVKTAIELINVMLGLNNGR